MEEKLNFLLNLHKLKELKRTGWIPFSERIKRIETTSDHTFRVAIICWILGEMKGLSGEKLIKTALIHDACEVYSGDITPFFHYDLDQLPKDEEKLKERLSKWVRLDKKEKERRWKMKFEREKEGMLKLIKNLEDDLKKEIFSLWLDCEKRISKEGSFVKQCDRIDILLQSIEYLGTDLKVSGTGWWEATEEMIDDPLLVDFLKVIQEKFYKKFSLFSKKKKLRGILEFFIKIGKLKTMPRLYWTLREIENAESVASHMFILAIMAWLFGREKELCMEKLLKMALCHEMSAVFTGDTTPYDRILPKDEKERKKVLEKMIRLSRKEKKWIFLEDYKKEKRAMGKLTKSLPKYQREEILKLWEDYRKRKSAEAKFLSQLNSIAVLLQGVLYEREKKGFSAKPLWEWAFEVCEDEICLEILEKIKEKFYGN